MLPSFLPASSLLRPLQGLTTASTLVQSMLTASTTPPSTDRRFSRFRRLGSTREMRRGANTHFSLPTTPGRRTTIDLHECSSRITFAERQGQPSCFRPLLLLLRPPFPDAPRLHYLLFRFFFPLILFLLACSFACRTRWYAASKGDHERAIEQSSSFLVFLNVTEDPASSNFENELQLHSFTLYRLSKAPAQTVSSETTPSEHLCSEGPPLSSSSHRSETSALQLNPSAPPQQKERDPPRSSSAMEARTAMEGGGDGG